ncbi:MAG: cell shape-determining protein, partial [Lutimonas sp.]
ENIELNDMGYLLALTGSNTINEYALNKFRADFGEEGAFRLISPEEMRDPSNNPDHGLFSHTDDFINISEVVRDYPMINEVEIKSREHFEEVIDATNKEIKSIPLFLKDLKEEIHILPADSSKIEVEPGYKLMYLGKKI